MNVLMVHIWVMGVLVLQGWVLVPMAVRAAKGVLALVHRVFSGVAMLVMGVAFMVWVLVGVGLGSVHMRVPVVFGLTLPMISSSVGRFLRVRLNGASGDGCSGSVSEYTPG